MQHDEFHPVLDVDDLVEICVFVQVIAMFARECCLAWIFLGEIHQQCANAQIGRVRFELLFVDEEHDRVFC